MLMDLQRPRTMVTDNRFAGTTADDIARLARVEVLRNIFKTYKAALDGKRKGECTVMVVSN